MGLATAIITGLPVLVLVASYSGECAFEVYATGHVMIGAEADGRTTPHDLGFAKMLRKAGGYVGAQASTRPALAVADRR